MTFRTFRPQPSRPWPPRARGSHGPTSGTGRPLGVRPATPRGLTGSRLFALVVALTVPAAAGAQGVGAGAPRVGVGLAQAEGVRTPDGAAAGRKGARRITPGALARLLARFAHEPSVAAVQRAAVRHALAEAQRPRRWLRRTARAAWLPTLQLGVGLQQRRDRGLDREVGTADLLRAGATNQIAYEIKMSWDLPRLIFDPNALRVIREAQRIAELREQVVLQVTRLYFERRRLQLTRWHRPVTTSAAALRRALRLAELTAVLNAMTGGLFRTRSRRAGPGAPSSGPSRPTGQRDAAGW